MNYPDIGPEKTALLVIDMQNAFVDTSSPLSVDMSEETIPTIAYVVVRGKACKIQCTGSAGS